MNSQQFSTDESPVGCGVVGCLVGLLLGFLSGGLLLIFLALILAGGDTPPLSTPPGPDLRLTVEEDFLNRFLQDATEEATRLDILPGSQVNIQIDTTASGFNMEIPIQVTMLLGLQAARQTIQVDLVDMQISGVELTPELRSQLSNDLPGMNQELNQVLNDISTTLGAPLVLTGLRTTDTEFQLEASESP